ncbi:MAG: small subunit ribosomal protein S7 [Parcubacteria group bacterium Gr01-1014_31]|nr:MAG: small subunit ribosomal protein S7 [Parcubacteria group bacterium Gr01-1014_31]
MVPDAKYGSATVTKFINYIMRKGKKSIARSILYQSFEDIAEKTKHDPREVFDAAVRNVGPEVEVRSRRVGGANYQIPTPVSPERRQALAFRWILAAAHTRKGQPMWQKLSAELTDAANKVGSAFKKREDVYRMAEANRAFAHFARFNRRK